jgi:hypothetical protein
MCLWFPSFSPIYRLFYLGLDLMSAVLQRNSHAETRRQRFSGGSVENTDDDARSIVEIPASREIFRRLLPRLRQLSSWATGTPSALQVA